MLRVCVCVIVSLCGSVCSVLFKNVSISKLIVRPTLFQQTQNSNLPLNALGSQLTSGLPSQPTLGSTPPPSISQQQQHAPTQVQVPPQPSTPSSTVGPSSTPTHMPGSIPRPPTAMSTPPDPSQPLTPLQPQSEPSSQMQQPTSVQAQHPATPVRRSSVLSA